MYLAFHLNEIQMLQKEAMAKESGGCELALFRDNARRGSCFVVKAVGLLFLNRFYVSTWVFVRKVTHPPDNLSHSLSCSGNASQHGVYHPTTSWLTAAVAVTSHLITRAALWHLIFVLLANCMAVFFSFSLSLPPSFSRSLSKWAMIQHCEGWWTVSFLVLVWEEREREKNISVWRHRSMS